MDNWSIDKEFLQTFRAEAEERLRNLGEGLMALENSPGDEELLKKLFREAHTLKGASGMMGFDAIRELAHRSEDILSSVQKGQVQLEKPVTDLLLETLDRIEEILPDTETGQVPESDITSLVERLIKVGGVEISDAPPKLTKGSVNPVTGNMPTATPIFTTACSMMLIVIPNARNVANGSLLLSAILTPR